LRGEAHERYYQIARWRRAAGREDTHIRKAPNESSSQQPESKRYPVGIFLVPARRVEIPDASVAHQLPSNRPCLRERVFVQPSPLFGPPALELVAFLGFRSSVSAEQNVSTKQSITISIGCWNPKAFGRLDVAP
jgi:hypothetical protein